jgi:hypothetical protein
MLQGTAGKKMEGAKERKQAQSLGHLHLQELQTANCWFNPLGGCAILLWWRQGITMELRSAF